MATQANEDPLVAGIRNSVDVNQLLTEGDGIAGVIEEMEEIEDIEPAR